jgi:putative nucleotidyltransferase with HDIG domain
VGRGLNGHEPGAASGEHKSGKLLFGENEVRVLTAIADITANAILRANLYEQTGQRLTQLMALRKIDTAINSGLDLRNMLGVVLEQALSQLKADAADILLLNPRLHVLEFADGQGFRSRLIERTRLRIDNGNAGRAVLDRLTISVPDISKERSIFGRVDLAVNEDFVAYWVSPMVAKGEIKGVIEIFFRRAFTPDPEWINFLEMLAAQAAISVDSIEMFNGLQRSNLELEIAYDTTIAGLSHALDMRDHETEGHSSRVAEMTERLAVKIGMSEADLVHVRRGALLHDIGKLSIPDNILLKPGQLTPDEWEIMRKHPVYAYELLAPIAHLRPALDIPYCHHEKWDGSGYPRGLKGDQIPMAARIFAIVDVWDALNSDRPYRPAWPRERIMDYIRANIGLHFDPAIAQRFIESGF